MNDENSKATLEMNPSWPYWQRLLFRLAFVWVGLVLATFPIPRPYLPDLGKILLPITTAIAAGVAEMIGLQQPYLVEIASDNTLLYVHLVLMFELALIVSSIWGWLDKDATNYRKLHWVFLSAARYFLAAAMFTYGFAKVFKTQFYLPEPNTLFTPMGQVPRDLLYWSTTGVSQHYSAFLGWTEVLVGLLLVFRRSKLLGGLLGIGVMTNVVAINFSYDISVKVYSSLLLLLCCIVVSPDLPRLWAFFRGRSSAESERWRPQFGIRWKRIAWRIAKVMVVSALIFDAVGEHLQHGNFNDDLAARPPYHGAYDVKTFISNGDTLAPDLRDRIRWRRIFIHRDGYLIVQGMDDQMHDYPMVIDTQSKQLKLADLRNNTIHYLDFQSTLGQLDELSGEFNGLLLKIQLTPLNWREIPLLQGEFHWTSDAM